MVVCDRVKKVLGEQIPTLKVPFPLSRDAVFLLMAPLIKGESKGGFVCGYLVNVVGEKRTRDIIRPL